MEKEEIIIVIIILIVLAFIAQFVYFSYIRPQAASRMPKAETGEIEAPTPFKPLGKSNSEILIDEPAGCTVQQFVDNF